MAGSLARSGYKFDGWNTSAYGTGISYNAGSTYTQNASKTLYAKWVRDVISTKPGNHVKSIEVETKSWYSWHKGVAKVVVVNEKGEPVRGAFVYGYFTGDRAMSWSAITDSSGTAKLLTNWGYNINTLGFCVTNIWYYSQPYLGNENVETCDSL